MRVAGIDVGSVNTKIAILEDGRLCYSKVTAGLGEGREIAQISMDQALSDCGWRLADIDYVVATGSSAVSAPFVNEPKSLVICLATGASHLFPNCRTVIDVGAEVSTVIRIGDRGNVVDFSGQDRCAAGAGAFLTALADLLQIPIGEMAEGALQGDKPYPFTCTCTVFIEQEIISTAFEVPPVPREDILAGLHEALAVRVGGLVAKVGARPDVVASGGVSRNPALIRSLERRVKMPTLVPECPEIVGALGAGLIAHRIATSRRGEA